MGDKNTRGSRVPLQVDQKFGHGCLNRHIERGRDFITDNQFRLGGKGPGDGDALLLTTRKLVRITIRKFFWQEYF